LVMERNAIVNTNLKRHTFVSADGTKYVWEEHEEASLTLEREEIEQLREYIQETTDRVLQNDTSGNGIPMGVKIPLSVERLEIFTEVVLSVIKLKEQLKIELSGHAEQRLEEDLINGEGHEEYRGWSSEEDVEQCVLSIEAVNSARLTINKRSLRSSEITFNSKIALEVRGVKPSGEVGTLALAIIEEDKIRIITLL